jgi:hypothetical protein
MKRRAFVLGFAAAFIMVASHLGLPIGTVRAAQVNSALSPDKGTFHVLLQGAEIGTEQFELAPKGDAWIVRGKM